MTTAGPKKIERDTYLFREGDTPDAMYVIKSGKFAVVKTKQNSEIILAELGPGSMVGEMAFFDNRPRSASVKAMRDSEVVSLPFKNLHAQFQTFPEWCKAIMRTVNESLRNANQRIKQLESTQTEGELFPPHQANKLISILNLVGTKFGKFSEVDKALVINGQILRTYTIQIFQEPTHKMQKLLVVLGSQGLAKQEDMGEGKSRVVIYKPEILYGFVEWYNEWLFKPEGDRTTIREEEIKTLNALISFASKLTPNDKGFVNLNLQDVQNDSMRELGYVIKVDETLALAEKKLIGEHTMGADGKGIFSTLHLGDLSKTVPFWSLIYALKKVQR